MTFIIFFAYFIAVGGKGGEYQYICLQSLVKANNLVNGWKTWIAENGSSKSGTTPSNERRRAQDPSA